MKRAVRRATWLVGVATKDRQRKEREGKRGKKRAPRKNKSRFDSDLYRHNSVPCEPHRKKDPVFKDMSCAVIYGGCM